MLFAQNTSCWICGKPIDLEQTRIDEFGFAYHEKCAEKDERRLDARPQQHQF